MPLSSLSSKAAGCMHVAARAASSSWDHLSLLCPLWLLSVAGTKCVLSLGNKEPAQIWLSGSKLGTTLNKTHRRGGTALTSLLVVSQSPSYVEATKKAYRMCHHDFE